MSSLNLTWADLTAPRALMLTAVALLIAVWRSGVLRWTLNRTINAYLCWRHPIKSVTGDRYIPTCQYEWPNGQGDIAKFLEGQQSRDKWERDLGSVYRIWNGTTPEVVLSRPEHLQAVFKDSNQHIKAVNNNTGWVLGELLGQCVGLISQDRWRVLRAVTEGPFVRSAAATHVPNIEERTRDHLAGLKAEGKFEQGIHPVDDLRFLPFWVIADTIYGKLPKNLEDDLQKIIPSREMLFHRAISGGWLRFDWTRHLPTSTKRELKEFKAAWTKFNLGAYEHAVAAPSSAKAPIVKMMSEVENGTVSMEALNQTLDEMLFANLDVTIGGLSWNLLFLAAEPEQQSALRDEIAASRKGTEADWHNYLLSSSTLLAACIYESARLKPLAAFSVPQAAPTDRIVGDYVIPARTNVIIDTHAINIKNPWWAADAGEYRPQRFIERGATQARYHYWRFGFGPRQCLGKYVADLVIRSLLVELVESYRLGFGAVKEDKESWQRKPSTWITQPDLKVICTPLH